MKKIKLENQLIVPVFQFLQEVTLKGKASRGRSQFVKRLEEKSKEYNEALTDIRKDYFVSDGVNDLAIEDGNYILKDGANEKELSEKNVELNKEVFEIQFGEYSTKYEALFDALDTLEEELNGQKAFAYNELMEAYEANEDKTEEEK